MYVDESPRTVREGGAKTQSLSEHESEVHPAPCCRICGGGLLRALGSVPGYVDGTSYNVSECSECRSQSVEGHAPDTLYNAIYKNRSVLDGYLRYESYAKHVRRWRKPLRSLAHCEAIYYGVSFLLQQEGGSSRDLPEILDIGSGLGYLTAALRQEGYAATGVDVSSEAVASAREMFGPWYTAMPVEELHQEHLSSKDIVLAMEVIEHVHSPRDFLESLVAIMRPGGRLIMSTPSRDYFEGEVVWSTDLPPIHLHWISKEGLRRLAAQLDLSVEFVDFRRYNTSIWGKSFSRDPQGRLRPQHSKLSSDYSPIQPPRAIERAAYATRFAPVICSVTRRLRPSGNPHLSEAGAIVARFTKN